MFQPITALFDSCVLYSTPIRDIIMELGITGLYHAKWTEQIHKEWMDNLMANRPDLPYEKLERTKTLMDQSIPDCLVEGYEALIETIHLPDPNDRHVVAAAIKSNCQIIVTENLKDFPANVLQKHDLTAVAPDDFFLDQIDLNQPLFLHALKKIRGRLKNPPRNAKEYLFILQQARLFKTVEEIEKYAEFI